MTARRRRGRRQPSALGKLAERVERHRHDPLVELADLPAELGQFADLEHTDAYSFVAQPVHCLEQLEDALVHSRRAAEQDQAVVLGQAEPAAHLVSIEPRRVEQCLIARMRNDGTAVTLFELDVRNRQRIDAGENGLTGTGPEPAVRQREIGVTARSAQLVGDRAPRPP